MTHIEMILYAVNEFRKQGKSSFSRKDIQTFLRINSEVWSASFGPVFQGMRADQPGGAPAVGERFRNVFIRTRRGIYLLTDYGITLAEEMFIHKPSLIQFASPENQTDVNLGNSTLNLLHRANLTKSIKVSSYSDKVQQILQNAEIYHQAYYRTEIFGKPCLYFHNQALNTRHVPTSVKHLEYVYATLVAWGMNRPGQGGAKMQDFNSFSKSIQQLNDCILKAQTYDYFSMDEEKWTILEQIFKGIHIMNSKTSLVGNSKAMHHMVPNVIPPIDRTYTLSFLSGKTNIRNDLNYEWQLMKEIILYFFIPVASDKKFQQLANNWMNKANEYPWDTSLLKVIDNIIVGQKK